MIETDWEAGQALIRCADELLEQEKDLRAAGYRELAWVLRDARLTIGDTFNALGSHDFALAGNSKPAKPTRRHK